ncbi:ScbR family autoregulator-binding transcription factor [Streptomyces microflavus]|uniref:ScbR family autoregulator-binding transcription factor n=1 Tax=Streptomyces microflavus TaxID=1919 RepID=UPI0036685EDB
MVVQERARVTRDRVLSAAGELFAQHGYHGTAISQVLEAAGVTKGALYFHFPGKAALAAGVLAHRPPALDLPPHPVRLQALITLMQTYAAALRTDPQLRGAAQLAAEPDFATGHDILPAVIAVRDLLTEAALAGELLPDVDPAESAELIITTFTGFYLRVQDTESGRSLEEWLVVMWRHLLPGLAMPGLAFALRALAENPAVAGEGTAATATEEAPEKIPAPG